MEMSGLLSQLNFYILITDFILWRVSVLSLWKQIKIYNLSEEGEDKFDFCDVNQ